MQRSHGSGGRAGELWALSYEKDAAYDTVTATVLAPSGSGEARDEEKEMADFVFNVAKGRVAELYHRVQVNDPTNAALIIVILGATGLDADATLIDFDTLGAILGGNNEIDNTGYARKVLVDSDLNAVAPDDTNDRMDLDIADQTWAAIAADGTQGNLAKLLVCYDPDTTAGDDTTIIPLTAHDFVVVADGSAVVAVVNSAGFYRAS